MSVNQDHFHCGPLSISLAASSSPLRDNVAKFLGQYDVPWSDAGLDLDLSLRLSDRQVRMIPGNYLAASRTHVDRNEQGLKVTCRSGASGVYDAQTQHWVLDVPDRPPDIWLVTDIEHMLSLALTTGWRHLGWVPLHAGAVVRDDICALLCAESGGGKTTLTTAFLHRGWQTLGDDKLLLRHTVKSGAELRGLSQAINLDQHASNWFPEIGDISLYPLSSNWTDKRRVPLADIWPNAIIPDASPTHIIQIALSDHAHDIRIALLGSADVLSTLLHQTVIPTHPPVAKKILSTVASTANHLKGVRLEIGQHAYHALDWLVDLEDALT